VLGTYLVIKLVSSKPTRLLNPKITRDIKDQKLFRVTAKKEQKLFHITAEKTRNYFVLLQKRPEILYYCRKDQKLFRVTAEKEQK
jgi:CTP synthase (UTP-ammonia lyase)